MSWRITHRDGEPRDGGTWRETEFVRPALLGGPGHDSSNGCELREHRNYNGSGSEAFGGAKDWPVVTLHVGLPAGREDLQKELGERLRALVDAFLAEKLS